MSCNQDCSQGRTCDCKPSKINVQSKDTIQAHFYVSLVKSGIRIVAGLSLMLGYIWAAGVLLIAAESLGVIEEIV